MDNRYVQQFKKGSLEMILLCLIGRKETYGYEIITELNNSASVLGYAKEGTIYPILYRLQEAPFLQIIIVFCSRPAHPRRRGIPSGRCPASGRGSHAQYAPAALPDGTRI